MIPVLYDKYETDFLSNGLGQLGDCLSCTVTEEVNGLYEVEFTYPMSGTYYEQLINFGGVVAVTHDHNGDVQLFDIYKYSAPINGIVTFYGSHVSYRLGNWVRNGTEGVQDGMSVRTVKSPAELFANWNTTSQTLFPPLGTFTFADHTGYDDGFFSPHIPYAVRDAMFNASDGNIYAPNGSVLQQWKGEWKFDNFNVDYYLKRGQDRGVQIRYGKNMTAVQREKDSGSVVSVIIPYWVDSSSESGTSTWYDPVYSPYMESVASPWEANGEQMYSGDVFYLTPAYLKAVPMDFSQDFQEEPTEAEIKQAALSYMSKNSTWRANDNITVTFLDLYNTPEYENIRGLSNCLVGDYVSVLYPQLGIVSNGVEIMKMTYDVLAEQVVSMELNTIRTTLAQVILDSIGGKS